MRRSSAHKPGGEADCSEDDQEDEADEDVVDRWFLEHGALLSSSRKAYTPSRGIVLKLPAVDLTITARDEALLNTNNVLHPGVRTPANKAGGENIRG